MLPKRHRSPRRLLKGLIFLLICSGVMAIIIYSPLFTMQRLMVSGNTYLTATEIKEIARIYRGEPLFKIETNTVMQNLTRDLRIESATVHRRLPDTIEVNIVERKPLATVTTDYGYVDFDRQGKVIACYKSLKNMTIPLITGIVLNNLYIGDDNGNETVQGVLTLLNGLDENSLNQLSEINLSSPKSIVVYTINNVEIKLGDLSRVDEKAELVNGFLKDLPNSKHKIEYVDFSYTAPVIRLRDMPNAEELSMPQGAQ